MTSEQILLFAILSAIFVLLIWGRWRYDLVAFGALVTALIVGAVPVEQAFQGFGHPATVVIALVLIISRSLSNAGVVELVASRLVDGARALWLHVGVMSGLAAVLSAMMNNVAALALLMPVDLQAARAAARSPARTLMPLSFAPTLGSMVTLIGTPPNIVIAAFRGETLGEPFTMFDFTPVGVVVAVVGVLFVTLIGRCHHSRSDPRRPPSAGAGPPGAPCRERCHGAAGGTGGARKTGGSFGAGLHRRCPGSGRPRSRGPGTGRGGGPPGCGDRGPVRAFHVAVATHRCRSAWSQPRGSAFCRAGPPSRGSGR